MTPNTVPPAPRLSGVAVVDDDPAALESFGALLESEGFHTTLFASCEEFLESPARPNGFGCLLLDARFPNMGGLELLDQLHRKGERIPTVFVMGRFDASARGRALRAPGVVTVLDKPVAAADLFAAIRKALST